MNEKPDINPYLFQLIMSHEAAAMQMMGKLAGAEGKIEKNLEMARYAIDTLEVLRDKTKGNLSEEEKRLLDHSLYQLHLNFVEESKAEREAKEKPSPEPAADEEPDSGEKPPAPETESSASPDKPASE
jgi:hypothetical protein